MTEAKHPHRQASDIAGVSHNTYAKVKWLMKNASEETKEALRAGKTTIGAEYKKLWTKESFTLPNRVNTPEKDSCSC